MSGVTEKETTENSPGRGTAAGSRAVRKAVSSRTVPNAGTSGTVVYIGPDIPGIAAQYTVYCSGLPEPLEEYIRDRPLFRSLVVPIGKLAQADAELRRAGSAVDVLYRKACEAVNGMKNKERRGNTNGL